MNRLDHALTMLAAAGSALVLAPASHATELLGTFSNADAGYVETFVIQSNGGFADPADGADYTNFALTHDSLGNTLATVGDGTTGYKAELAGKTGFDGYFGTGGAGSHAFNGQTYDSLVPPLYQQGSSPVLEPGTYYGDFDGFTLTLSAVPEPDVWTLLIVGAAAVGGATRAARRRRSALAA
ncbi:MAG: hypothetical protein JO111_06400 [Caulobacteraceae bacterium]|nr:hypothetical protein [Caulobacteraceae bacterium]